MIAPAHARPSVAASFRAKLLVAMMLVVSAITALALYFAERNLTATVEQDLQREFQGELDALHHVQELRHAALVERCRALVRRARIHAALEDNALDLLYPSANDELRDLMGAGEEPSAYALHAEFYRFLDRDGAVISPPRPAAVGALLPAEEAKLALAASPAGRQLGYLWRRLDDGTEGIAEIIATPIVSSETAETIATLVLGFKPSPPNGPHAAVIESGLWLDGRLRIEALPESERAAVEAEVTRAIAAHAPPTRLAHDIGGAPHLLFYNRLNPGSHYPPAYEVCIYPLDELYARQQHLRWQVLGAGVLLLLVGLAARNFLSSRFSRPVEKLAVASAEDREQRARAEAALELTSEELQRAARFSADASHQLKTPVTVLRAGLEELLAEENLTPEECANISALIHQTYRLSGVIEDLLLLSRMDAGRLKIDFSPVNLTQLIEAALDDLLAQPGEWELAVETDFPPDLYVAGDKGYLSLILQNLLENARKYNRPAGRVRLTAGERDGAVVLTIGNTGRCIPPAAHARIFERFHRGEVGENVPGYGLGLNLARELARIHQGDLRLLKSEDDWTEFEVRFRVAAQAMPAGGTG